jgi:gliding motility-associated-like protein
VNVINLIAREETAGVSCRDSVDGQVVMMLDTGVSIDSLIITAVPPVPILTTDTTITFDSLAPTTAYTLSVVGYGCEYSKPVQLSNKGVPPYTKQVSAPLCNDSCLGTIYIRCIGDETGGTLAVDTLRTGLCPGRYITNMTAPDGCPLSDTSEISRNHALDSLRAWADDTLVWEGESTTLHAAVGGGYTATFAWSPVTTIEQPDVADPVVTPVDSITVYTVTATSGGCTETASVKVRSIEVICGAPLFTIPNAFTPNADGVNDAVCFNTEQVVEFSIAIFNRWGEAVYRSDDASECWDGTYRGTPCPSGVYTYSCHIVCPGGHRSDMKGDITLIR